MYISCLISCSSYTPMLYFSFFIFILVLSYTFILYDFILYFYMVSSCTIHILHIHLYVLILSYTLCFRLLSVLYLFISFSCTIVYTFYILYSCTVHVLFSYTYIHVLFISYTGFQLYFSYDSHILCICVFTLTIELAFTTDSRGNLVMFVIQ